MSGSNRVVTLGSRALILYRSNNVELICCRCSKVLKLGDKVVSRNVRREHRNRGTPKLYCGTCWQGMFFDSGVSLDDDEEEIVESHSESGVRSWTHRNIGVSALENRKEYNKLYYELMRSLKGKKPRKSLDPPIDVRCRDDKTAYMREYMRRRRNIEEVNFRK